jgi:Rrf2 family protein
MIHLATLPSGTRVRLAALAEAAEVPATFMSKVLQSLVRARLIASCPGVNGGFELMASPSQVSILDIVEAIDGPLQLNLCVTTPPGCEREPWCAAHLVWAKAQQAMMKILRSATIGKLAQASLARRRASKTTTAK